MISEKITVNLLLIYCRHLIALVGLVCFSSYSNYAQNINSELSEYLTAQLNTGKFSGSVLIAKDGQVFFRQGYGMSNYETGKPNTPQTKFCIGSITKQFTAAVMMQLHEENLIDLNDNINQYLPNFPHGERITIHHLLTHTSGIPNYTDLDGADKRESEPHQPEEIIELFKDLSLEFEPGEKFHYSNSGYILLGYIIEKVSNQSFQDYLQEHIFSPFDMKHSGFGNGFHSLNDRALGYYNQKAELVEAQYMDLSYAYAAGGIYSTVEDLYLWGQGLHTGQVIKEKSLENMITPRYPSMLIGNDYYGYGTIIDSVFNRLRIGHGGQINGYIGYYSRFIDKSLTIIVLNNIWNETSWIDQVSKDLAAIILGENYTIPVERTFVELTSDIISKIIGEYELAPNFTLTITEENNRLFGQATGQHKMEIFPESNLEFFMREIEAEITLTTNRKGEVIGMSFLQDGQSHPAKKIK